MFAVFFAGKRFGQIWIAFPIALEVSIVQPRIPVKLRSAVAGDAAMRQRISVRMTNHFLVGHRVADEIAITGGIAPLPFRVPMPRLSEQFRVLTIGNRAPARFEHLFDLVWTKENVSGIAGDAVERCP